MDKILCGKQASKKVKDMVKKEVEVLKKKGVEVFLVVILVGKDKASAIYVKNKQKACEETGIISKTIELDENIKEKELLDIIDGLNKDKKVNGILVQLPLPKHIDEKNVIDKIDYLKDVDCFNIKNIGKLVVGKFCFLPCTPSGIIDLIEQKGIDLKGKHCVIVGRSNIVGKPLAFLMLQKDATVSICHSKTLNLEFFTRSADVLVVAVGKENFITKDMVKKGAIVIDVGINRNKEGKICGDVKYDEVYDVAEFITPVPGGVGPMTIAMLMKNTLFAAKIQNKLFYN